MTCPDCGFEHDAPGVCPRCGFDPAAPLSLLDAVKTPNPPIENPLETEFAKLCKEAEAGKVSKERVNSHWASINERARAGNRDARHIVARVALAQQDYPAARKMLADLVDAGHILAQLDLAKIYEEGLGVEKDAFRAVRLLREPARQGNPIALFTLANHHLEGGCLTPDPLQAQATLQALVAVHPTLFRRPQGCACANGLTDAEFARKTASQIGAFVKYALLAATAALVIALVWTELNP